MKDIIEIANQFKINNNVINIQEYGNGNINKTYLITTDKENNKYFILQRINTDVFLKPESVMQNMCIVTEHIHKRIQSSDVTSIYNWKVPRIIQTHANQNYWIAPDKTFWRRTMISAADTAFILAAAGLGSALGWGLICSKFLEGIARQPEMRPQLMGQMLFTGGLMEAFPMIVLGMAMWFVFANPFADAVKTASGS